MPQIKLYEREGAIPERSVLYISRDKAQQRADLADSMPPGSIIFDNAVLRVLLVELTDEELGTLNTKGFIDRISVASLRS